MRLLQNITILIFLFTGIYSSARLCDVSSGSDQEIAAVMVEGEHITATALSGVMSADFSRSFLQTTPHNFANLTESVRNDHYSEYDTPPPEVA